MGYNYYCTYCGRELSQDTILLDMTPVLTGSTETKFRTLSFRITKAEFESFIRKGTPSDLGFVECKLSFKDLAFYISNKNNQNDNQDNPYIATLTLDQIQEYIQFTTPRVAPAMSSPSGYSWFNKPKQESEEQKNSESEFQSVYQPSQAIAALERSSKKNQDIELTRQDLRADFEILLSCFPQNGEYHFQLKPNFENDNQGQLVLTGYMVRIHNRHTDVDARLCPYCGEPIFQHAGTSEHRTITFIGDQAAGKTSTIAALTHYVQRAAIATFADDPIWGNSLPIDSIASIELLSPSEKLRRDLSDYEQGFAPAKTPAANRLDAYSATFRIKNKCENRYYLLTLTDLPGELCGNDGSIDTDKIYNLFQVALACDAFVLCFDTSTIADVKILSKIQNACSWANNFQILRSNWKMNVKANEEGSSQKEAKLIAPVMLILNKCPDLETEQELMPPQKGNLNPVSRTYVFDRERQIIDSNAAYQVLGDQIAYYNALTNAYHARLRVSPIGFAAPRRSDYEKIDIVSGDPTGDSFLQPRQQTHTQAVPMRVPEPKHIPELMRWLLEVSGCIPVESAAYYPEPDSKERVCSYEDNFCLRTQYRTQLPNSHLKDGDLREALIRCYLFENPTDEDTELLDNYDQPFALRWVRLKRMKRQLFEHQ